MIPWDEFNGLIGRGLSLFSLIRDIVDEYMRGYDPPKTVRSRMRDDEAETDYTLHFDPKTGAFGFTTGKWSPEKRPQLPRGSAGATPQLLTNVRVALRTFIARTFRIAKILRSPVP